MLGVKLQALVYDILPPTTAITDYAVGLRKLSPNEQVLLGAQMAVRLSQKLLGVSFTTAHVAFSSTNKTKIV